MERLQFWRLDNEGIRVLMGLSAHLARSGLENSLLDLVYLRVSQLTNCSQCVDAHTRDAIAHGVEQQLVNGVSDWRDAPFFTERQRAGLAWAEALTEISKTRAPDELYREVSGQFSETELVHLTLAIALMNALARIAIAFRHGPPPMPAVSESALR